MTAAEQAEFNRLHGIGENGEEAHSIFTDRDPATTIKGCGFRNCATALQTLLLIEQPGVRYKQYWTVRAMLERAQRHPAVMAVTSNQGHVTASPAANMLGAIRIFEAWMADRGDGSGACRAKQGNFNLQKKLATEETLAARSSSLDSSKFTASEMAHRARFARCKILNGHGGTAEEERDFGKDMQRRHTKDQADGKRCLRDAAQRLDGKRIFRTATREDWFDFPGVAFSSVFGGPGVHSYGTLTERDPSTETVETLIVRVRATERNRQKRSGDFCGADCTVSKSGMKAGLPHWLSNLMAAVGVERHTLIEQELSNCGQEVDDPGGLQSLGLGKMFETWESFNLEYEVQKQRGRFSDVVKSQDRRQPSILDMFASKKADVPTAKHADVESAAKRQKVIVLSDSD